MVVGAFSFCSTSGRSMRFCEVATLGESSITDFVSLETSDSAPSADPCPEYILGESMC